MYEIAVILYVFSIPLLVIFIAGIYFIQNQAEKDTPINEHIIKAENKKFKKLLYQAKNFLRPASIPYFEMAIFANKYCIVKFLWDSIIFYDKINDYGYSCQRMGCSLINCYEFKNLCKKFNFETKIEDADDISHALSNIEKTELTNNEKISFRNYTLNNMSVAELITLPGINMGKANKLQKFMKTHQFRNLTEFIDYAKIGSEDAKTIAKSFNNNLKLKPIENENK